MSTAYLVGFIDLDHGRLSYVGADIFSDDKPTINMQRQITVTLLEESADTFERAAADLVTQLRQLAGTSKVWSLVLRQLETWSRASKTGLGGLNRRT